MPELTVPPELNDPYKCLKDEIDGYIDYSRTWMRVWAAVYYFMRTALIVLSACVAAKDSFGWKEYLPIMSLAVAIGTALDTWLKTGNRYKGHYTFNDKFISLFTDVELTSSQDTASLIKAKNEFKKLIEDYAVAVLPT
jgi:hypothetical protein